MITKELICFLRLHKRSDLFGEFRIPLQEILKLASNCLRFLYVCFLQSPLSCDLLSTGQQVGDQVRLIRMLLRVLGERLFTRTVLAIQSLDCRYKSLTFLDQGPTFVVINPWNALCAIDPRLENVQHRQMLSKNRV